MRLIFHLTCQLFKLLLKKHVKKTPTHESVSV